MWDEQQFVPSFVVNEIDLQKIHLKRYNNE